MSLLDLGGGFPGTEGSEAKFKEVSWMAPGYEWQSENSSLGWGEKCVRMPVCLYIEPRITGSLSVDTVV